MVTCAVSNCKNSSSKMSKNKDGITFHRFPRCKRRRRQWEVAINREDEWSCSDASAVCSEHFECSDFYLTENGLRRLSLKAVPSINISPCQQREPTVALVETEDILPSDTEEIIKLKQKIHRIEVIAENRRKRLIRVCQKQRRIRIKLVRMKKIIRHMIKANNANRVPKLNHRDLQTNMDKILQETQIT